MTSYEHILPPLSTDEFAALKADIKANGVQVPIVVDENGAILDGHHRFKIDKNAPRRVVEGLSLGEKEAYTIRANLARRNLSPEQRREVTRRQQAIAERLRTDDPKRWTQKAVATVLGVARETVRDWFDVKTTSNGGTAKACKKPDARVKVNTAAKAEIVQRIEAGETQEQVAADYGITQQTVSLIVKKASESEARNRKREIDLRTAIEVAPTVAVGDAVEWIERQDDCDLLLTDPPYSTDVEDVAKFAAHWLPVALGKVKPTGRAFVCIGAYPEELAAYLAVAMPTQVLVWTYRNTLGPSPKRGYKLNWQAILYYEMPDAPEIDCPKMTEQFSVQDINAPDGRQGDRYHAWQKPMQLGERFVRHSTKPGDLVLDPFCCTGSFLLAASSLRRVGRGCDLNEGNLAIAIERGCQHE